MFLSLQAHPEFWTSRFVVLLVSAPVEMMMQIRDAKHFYPLPR